MVDKLSFIVNKMNIFLPIKSKIYSHPTMQNLVFYSFFTYLKNEVSSGCYVWKKINNFKKSRKIYILIKCNVK